MVDARTDRFPERSAEGELRERAGMDAMDVTA